MSLLPQRRLPWLESGEPFPAVEQAWGPHDPVPGLLAAGGALDAATLQLAYRHGIFPWFSAGDPILWWSPDPRMVLPTAQFKLHRSLLQALRRFIGTPGCEVRFDTAFSQVIRACAHRGRLPASAEGTQREGAMEALGEAATSTWILPEMVSAYEQLHRLGVAHSVETWVNGVLVGGLYLVAVGRAVFGESMFTHRTDASKIALAALVAFARVHDIGLIDCQQNTGHLASLGAREMPRDAFAAHVRQAADQPPLDWVFSPLYWSELSPKLVPSTPPLIA